LRERRKAWTRSEIQQHALRLFRERGYNATTVDQIAEAAEVSQSTFFRYFATKEDLVLRDEYDRRIVDEVLLQPADLPPIQVVRNAIQAVYARSSAEELAQEQERFQLIRSTPELRPRMLDTLTEGIMLMADALAERAGREKGDFAARTFAGALIGVSLSSMLAAGEDGAADFISLYDAGLELLEKGLPL